MAISPFSVSGLLNTVGPPGSPGMTVVADKNLTGGVTTGTPINQPDLFIPGGSHGSESDVIIDGAQQVVPFYDGTNYAKTSLPAKQPASFSTAPGSMDLSAKPPDNFTVWNSAYQAEYVKANGGAGHDMVTIGLPGNQLHVVLSSTNDRVFVLENLQKNDFAKLPLADQANIAATTYFTSIIGPTLNLTAAKTGPQSRETAIDAIKSYLSALGYTLPASDADRIAFFSDFSTSPAAGGGSTPDGLTLANMPAADRKIFADELKLLGKQIYGMGIFSLPDLANATKAISDRLSLAARFSGITACPTDTVDLTKKYTNLYSADGNATLMRGYTNLIQQESQIRNVSLAADQLVTSGNLSGSNKKLDAPTLIFYFQLDANLVQEAEINASTEEIKQLNALLNLYSQMQGLINQTLEKFGDDAKQKLGLLGNADGTNWSSSTIPTSPQPSSQVIAAIFEDYMGASSQHPLEAAYGIKKPNYDMVYNVTDSNHASGYLNPNLKDSWNAFNSSLSDTVSQLNQQSQLKMNDINSATKQKDRHFDLANNSLSKMNDMIQTIGRGLA